MKSLRKSLRFILSTALCLSVVFGLTTFVNAQTTGCLPGNAFNTTTGQPCGTNLGASGAIEGCFPGYAFSTKTGQSCAGAMVDTGCVVGNAYSTLTGAVCPPRTVSPGFPSTGVQPMNFGIIASLILALGAGSVAGVMLAGKRLSH